MRSIRGNCGQQNALDFDDLIMVTVQMFRQHKHVLEQYQRRFAYLLVDEYQDTNMGPIRACPSFG